MLLFVNPDSKPARKPEVSVIEQPAENSKPSFRKDGELRFLKRKSNEEIARINIEVADNEAEKEQGLMYRESMAEDNGMLFLMGTEEIQTFWMKNTIISLDILYVDSERRIISIHENCTPYSLDHIPSLKPALYVVEVNAGYTAKHGIKVGDLISF